MEPIFAYSDYRKYLADYFADQKKTKPQFSHRFFAEKAGFRTSNFLHLVITGRRNLAKESLVKIGLAINLSKTEMEYLENLVFFNQSQAIKEKTYYYEKLTAFRRGSFIQEINQDQFEYLSSWLHPVVREAASFDQGLLSTEKIAGKIRPRVSVAEVEKSLHLLLRLGLLQRKQGRYVQTAPLLSTGLAAAPLAAVNFHLKTMALAAESLERFPADRREIRSLTLGINKENFNKIQKRIHTFRKEILEIAGEGRPDRVYQMNLHLFPVTATDD
jgi:uncharacterized protein (TIGR02147 family)